MNGALTASLSAERRVSQVQEIRETQAEIGMAHKERERERGERV